MRIYTVAHLPGGIGNVPTTLGERLDPLDSGLSRLMRCNIPSRSWVFLSINPLGISGDLPISLCSVRSMKGYFACVAVPLALLYYTEGATRVVAQPSQNHTPTNSSVECSTLWGLAQSLSGDERERSSGGRWEVVKQLRNAECLKSRGKRSATRSLVTDSEKLVLQEIRRRAPEDLILTHLGELAAAQVSAKMYEEVVETFRRVVPQLEDAGLKPMIRVQRSWFDYVEVVVAAAFAINRIDEGLKIAEGEFSSSRGVPASLQACFAVGVGDLLLSKVRVRDALRFYSLALKLDQGGARSQRALYWLTLDQYQKGDVKAAQKLLGQVKAAKPDLDIKGRVAALEKIVASDNRAQRTTGQQDPEFLRVWRDLNLISQR